MRPYYYLLLTVFVAFFASCTPRLYYPESANTPGFKEAGEFKGTFGLKAQDFYKGSSPVSPFIDAAYSFTDHFAVVGSYKGMTNRYDGNGSGFVSNIYNGHRVEVGAGCYTTFRKKGRAEIYGGYGNGYISRLTDDAYMNGDFTTHYHRLFLQPAVGFSNDIFSVMAGVKLAAQFYYNFQAGDPTLIYSIADNNVDVTRQNFVFAEPFVHIEIGYRQLRMCSQVGFSSQVAGGNIISQGGPLYYTVGFTYYYAPRFFKVRTVRVIHTEK